MLTSSLSLTTICRNQTRLKRQNHFKSSVSLREIVSVQTFICRRNHSNLYSNELSCSNSGWDICLTYEIEPIYQRTTNKPCIEPKSRCLESLGSGQSQQLTNKQTNPKSERPDSIPPIVLHKV